METEHNITITPTAFDKIKDIMLHNQTNGLRVFVQGGGCSGFSYGFGFAKEIADDDLVISKSGVNVVIDPMSMMYLEDAIVDYKVDIMSEQFVIENPNIKTKCGCGQSFTMG